MKKLHIAAAAAIGLLTIPLLAQNNPASLAPPVAVKDSRTAEASVAPPVTVGLPATSNQLTAQDLNAWLDGFLPYALAKGDVPGAVVIVVKDGAILSQRGFGYANVEKRTPVDPERTLFRPGSVSKLFTWTAVMQQVEQGKLNLDEDVNTYLDFKIPPYEGKPITLRQIMKHTAGFEEQMKGIMNTDPDQNIAYEKLLKAWVPERVYAPGSTPAYSNYATSLAGYIVERVSGEPFVEYVQRHVLAPLGMRNSTFAQPLPPRLQPLMSEGYQSGRKDPWGFEYVGPAPAGSLSASGTDMGRFMIAHLQGGALGENRILKPETARLMHTSVTTPIPPLHGIALGFYQSDINGRRVISHGGDTVAFHSDLNLFLDDGVGIFVSFNSAGREGAVGPLRNAILANFADRYFPGPKDNRQLDPKTARQNAELLAGTWVNSRGAHSSFMHSLGLLSQAEVGVGKDGELLTPFSRGLNGQPRTWIAVAPGVWRDRDSEEMLAAQIVDGKAVRFSLHGVAPIMVWDRAPWYKSSGLLLPLVFFSLAVLILTALLWPVRAIVRRNFKATLPLEKRDLRLFRLTRIFAILMAATLIGWAATIGVMMSNINNLNAAFDPLIIILQVSSIVAFIGGFAVMAWNLWSVWTGKHRWPARVWSIALLIAAITLLWVSLAFNLIGFGVNY